MEIKIEKGIPTPTENWNSSTVVVLRQMDVGDSALFPECTPFFASSVNTAAKRLGITVVTRKEGNGRRVWRQS